MMLFENYTRQHEIYFTKNCNIEHIDLPDMDRLIQEFLLLETKDGSCTLFPSIKFRPIELS